MDFTLRLRLRDSTRQPTRRRATAASLGHPLFWVTLVVLVALLDPAAAEIVIRVLAAIAGQG